MKNHKEFFQYVIPSMLAFALSGVYSIWETALWLLLMWPIP